jgi:hypothetical protein
LGNQNLEDNEQIKVEPKSRTELHQMIQDNRIVDAKTIATLLKFFTTP